jgi:hypothetical protein
MNIEVIYSIGIRCYTEIILKRLGLIRFSSIFGSLNISNYENLIKCFDSNFKILLDESNLVYTKNISDMNNDNNKYGFRTLNKEFHNIEDFHSATFAHHDLTNYNDKSHFFRGLERLVYIRNNNIPILFVNISMEYDNTNNYSKLICSIINNGFKNMKILSIYKTNCVNKIELIYISDHIIIYKIPTDGYDSIEDDNIIINIIINIIKEHFNYDNLLNITDVPITAINTDK